MAARITGLFYSLQPSDRVLVGNLRERGETWKATILLTE